MSTERIVGAVGLAIDKINKSRQVDRKLGKSLDSVLLGPSGNLDSLALVSLIIGVEEKIEEEFEITVTITDDLVMSGELSPFRTVGSLVEHIAGLIE